jgi:hypothetical protein
MFDCRSSAKAQLIGSGRSIRCAALRAALGIAAQDSMWGQAGIRLALWLERLELAEGYASHTVTPIEVELG